MERVVADVSPRETFGACEGWELPGELKLEGVRLAIRQDLAPDRLGGWRSEAGVCFECSHR